MRDQREQSGAVSAPQQQAANFNRAFGIGIALNTGYVVLEAVMGLSAGSLALLADAGHNLTDVLSLLLAWGAAWLSRREPTHSHTYGFRRASILASLINSIILLVAIGAIAWEAVRRFSHPQPIDGGVVLLVAAAGIIINAVTAWLFMAGRKGDINIRGAFLHMAADAAVSAGVVAAALMIMKTGWLWLDPAMSLVIVAVILVGTWSLLRESTNLVMDAVPEDVERSDVADYLDALPGVRSHHDLHIWGVSTTETALTVHLVRPEAPPDDAFLAEMRKELSQRFGIGHATIQIESGDPRFTCEMAPADTL